MAALLESLKAGEPALLATDTVYGVAALPGTFGLEAIFKLKERPAAQALPWLVAGEDWLDRYGANIPAYARELAAEYWPGALTLVVKASPAALSLGGLQQDGTVALRCPNNDACLNLLRALDAPLACTSANVHGQPAPACLEQVDPRFLELAHALDIAPACPAAIASTVVDCTGPRPRILREGAVGAASILKP